MKILQIVTLFSSDGAYGGPMTVALNQCRELVARGHHVTVMGAHRGDDRPPEVIDGVRCRWFPAAQAVAGMGFAGLRARGMLGELGSVAADHDLTHVHLARDLVTLPAATLLRRNGSAYVVQTHGMIVPSTRLLAGPLDRLCTIPVLRDARSVMYLTDHERRQLNAVAGDLRVTPLHNGVPHVVEPVVPGPVTSDVPEVLFLARLHRRKRPEMFSRVAARLLAEGVPARFTLVGPPGGAEADVERTIGAANNPALQWSGPIAPDHVTNRLAQCALSVLPSVDEPYPMSVLEAMAVGRAVIVTASCGLASAIDRMGCGIVVDDSEEALTRAIRFYLEHPVALAADGARGRAAAREEFGMAVVVDRLEEIYHRAGAFRLGLVKEKTA